METIEKEIIGNNDIACLYFYFRECRDIQPSFEHIWATLLCQLLQRGRRGMIAEELKTEFDHTCRSRRLHPDKYLAWFKAQAAAFKTIYLMLDDLNSYEIASSGTTRRSVQDILEKLPKNVRVLFTSCDESLGKRFGERQALRIRPDQHAVETYVESRIRSSENLDALLSAEQGRREIVSKVTESTLASGM